MLDLERSIVKLRKKKRREWLLRLSCPRIGVTLHRQRLIDMAYLATWEAIICNWTNHWILTKIKAQPTEEQTWYHRVITIQSSCNQSNKRAIDTRLCRITIHLREWRYKKAKQTYWTSSNPTWIQGNLLSFRILWLPLDLLHQDLSIMIKETSQRFSIHHFS